MMGAGEHTGHVLHSLRDIVPNCYANTNHRLITSYQHYVQESPSLKNVNTSGTALAQQCKQSWFEMLTGGVI